MPFELNAQELGLELDDDAVAKLTGAFQKALDAEVTGLKSKNSELLGNNKAIKSELDTFKGQFEGLDINAVKGLLQRAGQDEETRLLAEGKLDEVIGKRTERLRGEYDKQLKTEKERADKAETFASKFRDKVLADAIRSAAIKAGALPEASEDIILRAKGTFTLNENGEAVAVDADGEVIYGKDGKSPLNPLEWAESLRETAPHLWPRAQGAGPTGDHGGKAAKKWGDLNETQRATLARENPEAFTKLLATRE